MPFMVVGMDAIVRLVVGKLNTLRYLAIGIRRAAVGRMRLASDM